jgi:chromosome segregation ATPase
MFWRVCGGTLLSIGALAVVTVYQSLTGSINEMRAELNRANEARADMVKKEEYASLQTKIWDRMQNLQKDLTTVQLEMNGSVKERMNSLDLQLKSASATQKDVQALQQSLAALQEKSTLRDQHLKEIEDERKELVKEVQALRERLAKLEAATDIRPAAKTAARPISDLNSDHGGK